MFVRKEMGVRQFKSFISFHFSANEGDKKQTEQPES